MLSVWFDSLLSSPECWFKMLRSLTSLLIPQSWRDLRVNRQRGFQKSSSIRNMDLTFSSGQSTFVSLKWWIYGNLHRNMSLHVAFGQIPISPKRKAKKKQVLGLPLPTELQRKTNMVPSSCSQEWKKKRNRGVGCSLWKTTYEKSLPAKSLKFALKHCSACIK